MYKKQSGTTALQLAPMYHMVKYNSNTQTQMYIMHMYQYLKPNSNSR